jgi:hypothetical protein
MRLLSCGVCWNTCNTGEKAENSSLHTCWHQTDVPGQADDVCSLRVKRTCRASPDTSVFDPQQASDAPDRQDPNK